MGEDNEYKRRMKVRKVADNLDISIRILAIVAFLVLITSLVYVTWVK